MKLLFMACAMLATANVAYSERNLGDDLDDFMDLMPIEEIFQTFMFYWDFDEEFQQMQEYFSTEDYRMFLANVTEMPEIKSAINYLEESGIPVQDCIDKYFNSTEILNPMVRKKYKKGVAGFLKYLEKNIPYEKIVKLYLEKLQTSKYISDIDKAMRSPDAQNVVDNLWKMVKFQEGLGFFKSLGVKIDKYFAFLTLHYGIRFQPMDFDWDEKTMSLYQDFKAIINVSPVNDMRDLFYYYFKSDEIFKQVMDYVFSDEFKKTVLLVESFPETEIAMKFMEKQKFPAKKFLKFLNYILYAGIKDVPDVTPRQITGELAGFFTDEMSLVPWEKVKITINQRMSMSKYFRNFYKAVTSGYFKMYLENLYETKEVQSVMEKIDGMITNKEVHYEMMPYLVMMTFMNYYESVLY